MILLPDKVDYDCPFSGCSYARGLGGAWEVEQGLKGSPRSRRDKGCHEGASHPQPVSPCQVPETMLQEILPKVLKPDLNSVFGSPEHLELFLLAQQKVPKKLEKLMGPVNLFSDENVPRCEGGREVGCLIPGAASPSTGLHHDPELGGSMWPQAPGPCLLGNAP